MAPIIIPTVIFIAAQIIASSNEVFAEANMP